MKVLITGCSGFIGSHLCERLMEEGDYYEVIGIDISPLPPDFMYKDKMIFVHEDIRNSIRSIGMYKPDLVIHLAALAGVHNSTRMPQDYVESNIIGTINLLEECKLHGIPKIIYASSSTVYANEVNKERLNTTCSLLSPYAITKKSCEMLFQYYKIQSIGLRFFSVYGPRGRKDMAPFIFIHKILNEEPIEIFGNGNMKRDFTYISDIINGIVLSIQYICKNQFQHEIFNLGNCKSFTVRHFISVIEAYTQKKATLKYVEKRDCDSEITHADLTKSKTMLKYEPIVSLEKGIEKTVDYFSSLLHGSRKYK